LDLLGFDQAVHSWPVAKAIDTIEQRGCGVLVFLNCGTSPQVLFDQMAGRKTSAALPAQNSANAASSMALRNYGMGAAILKDLGVGKMKLLAQPRKMPSMMGFGLEVTGYLQPQ
jgi:3,4-dihydroxy 2-butanone 4-phosphate synthase/GTP cyclohydrolase II